MNRILEIALNNSTSRLSEDFQPDRLFKRQAAPSVHVSNINEVPIEPEKEDWEVLSSETYNFLRKEFKFLQTKHMMYFVNESIRKSDEINHHPVIIIDKDIVTIETYTHDINDITSLDKDLAEFMDEVYQDIVYITGL